MDILNLHHFSILGFNENEHDFQIQVDATSQPSHCPHCGSLPNLYKHSNREQLVMDLPIHASE